MCSTSSAELAASVSDLNELECEQSRSAKSNHSRGLSSPSDSPESQFTMMFEPSPPLDYEEMGSPLTSSAEAFPAKTSALLERRPGSKPRGAVSGRKSLDLLANYDQVSSSWRTSQISLVALANDEAGGLDEFSETWPRSGLMRSGIAYKRPQSALHMVGTEFGSLPTPTKSDAEAHHSDIRRFDSLSVELRKMHGYPSRPRPSYLEWMMGFPIGWTDVQPSETPSSLKSQKSSAEQS